MMRCRHLALLLGLCACPAGQQAKPRADGLRVVAGEVDANKLLAAPAERAREAGAGPLTAVGARVVNDGEQLGSFVEIPTNACALVIARAGKSIGDIDLFIYSDGGDRLASDEAPESRAAVMICPPHPRRVYVVARSVSGDGMIALGVMPVPTDKADAVSAALSVRGRPGQDTGKLAQWPGLERTIRERRAALGSTWQDVRRVAVPLSPHAYTTVSAEVEARRCVDVLIVPSDEVAGVDVMLVDDHGRTIARGQPPGRNREFVICAESPQPFSIMLRPRVSSGLAAVIIGRSEPGAVTELSAGTPVVGATPLVPLGDALVRHRQRLSQLQLAEPGERFESKAVVGASVAMELTLEAGCSRIDVVGGIPLGRFDAELWSPGGRHLMRVGGGERASAFVCGPARKVLLEVTATDREGPFAVERRHDAKPAAVLLQHPVAASRLLTRLEAAWGPVEPAAAAAAQHVVVSHDARASVSVPIEAGRCVDVVAALGEGASDLTMSIAPLGGPATQSGGLTSTVQHVCAGPKPQSATVHIGVAQGQTDALVLVVEP